MDTLLEFMNYLVTNIGQSLLHVLPTSPFRGFIDSFQPGQYVAWLNWFVPVQAIVSIFGVWLLAVAGFYLYSILMRWIKMIGD